MSLEDLTPQQLIESHRKLEEQSRLFNTLLADPTTRAETLALVKKKNPSMVIPEIDAQTAIEAKISVEREERQKLEKQIQERDIRDRIDRERVRCMKAYDLSESDMVEVEKIMTDKDAPIPHYDAACKVHRASKAQATPTAISIAPQKWDMPEKDVWAGGIGNRQKLNSIALDEAYKAFGEIRGSAKAA